MPVTKRDQIWREALHLRKATESETARENLDLKDRYGIPGFTVQDLERQITEPVVERTIRDCLNAMVELNVLSKRETRPSRYRAPQESRLRQ